MDPKIQTTSVVRLSRDLNKGEPWGRNEFDTVHFKAKVALEALKVKPVNELAGQYQVHPTQISQWKRQVQGGVREIFATARAKGDRRCSSETVVGRLKMELDWIKKTAGLSCKRQSDFRTSAFDDSVSCWASDEPIGMTTRLRRACGDIEIESYILREPTDRVLNGVVP